VNGAQAADAAQRRELGARLLAAPRDLFDYLGLMVDVLGTMSEEHHAQIHGGRAHQKAKP
jgi:hypothetical protein